MGDDQTVLNGVEVDRVIKRMAYEILETRLEILFLDRLMPAWYKKSDLKRHRTLRMLLETSQYERFR